MNNQTGPGPELRTTQQINFHPDLSGWLGITHQPLQRRHCRAYFVFLLRSRVCLLVLAGLLPWKPDRLASPSSPGTSWTGDQNTQTPPVRGGREVRGRSEGRQVNVCGGFLFTFRWIKPGGRTGRPSIVCICSGRSDGTGGQQNLDSEAPGSV